MSTEPFSISNAPSSYLHSRTGCTSPRPKTVRFLSNIKLRFILQTGMYFSRQLRGRARKIGHASPRLRSSFFTTRAGQLPSNLRGAKKRLIAAVPNSKFELTNWNHSHLTFSNSRSTPLSAIDKPDSNRPLETIRNGRNSFSFKRITFSNRIIYLTKVQAFHILSPCLLLLGLGRQRPDAMLQILAD